MTLTSHHLEELAVWCATAPSLDAAREEAVRAFLGEADERPVRYWPGVGGDASIERRFVGWLMFASLRRGGRRPAEDAADALYSGALRAEALEAVRGARYLLAVVTAMRPRGVILQVGDEVLEVRSADWARSFTTGVAVVAHIVPVGRDVWLPGPGWCEWPTQVGRGFRQELKQLQLDPIQMERFLQGRAERRGPVRVAAPLGSTLEQAVGRMTEEATREGRPRLVMSAEEWRALVWGYLRKPDAPGFAREIIHRAELTDDVDELNRWLALAMDVWNATPQPDKAARPHTSSPRRNGSSNAMGA